MTVGFIGLGKMGRPMASNLVRKGFSLIVHDINLEPVRALEALGARAASTARDVAAASDIVITMLPDSSAVKSVVTGQDGVLAHLQSGGVLVDMSTIDPRVTDALASEAAGRGVAFVDAPVG